MSTFFSSDAVSPPELIITSSGDNIPPVPIENRIKDEIPFLSNVMVIGDQRQFLTCLVTLKVHLQYCHTYTIKIKKSHSKWREKKIYRNKL